MTAADDHRRGCAFDGCAHGGHPVTDDDCPCERLSCSCGAAAHIGCETCDSDPWLIRMGACPDCEGSGCDPTCPDLDVAS